MDDSLYVLLQKIREKPGLYIYGMENWLTNFRNFISGYLQRIRDEGNAEYQDCISFWEWEFNEFVAAYYNKSIESEDWFLMILKQTSSDKEAFDKFYELLDKFIELNSERMKNSHVLKFILNPKLDLGVIDELTRISESEMELILPHLILWIEKSDLFIEEPFVKLLIRHSNILIPVIKKKLSILEHNHILKCRILQKLVPELPVEYQKMLVEDLECICSNPTWSEELQDTAKALLDKLK